MCDAVHVSTFKHRKCELGSPGECIIFFLLVWNWLPLLAMKLGAVFCGMFWIDLLSEY